MKKIILLTAIFASFAGQAQDFKKIKCSLQSQYGGRATFTKDHGGLMGVSKDRNQVEISFSDTECEDSTSIKMTEKAYQALLAGKAVTAEVDFADPELQIKGYAKCEVIQ
jgi:hypothetical protein